MLSINSSTAALSTQYQLEQSRKKTAQTLAELGSGSQLDSASVNAANAAMSQSLQTQINGNNQAESNAYDGISMLQTASGALSQLQSNTQQIQTLAVQAGDGALNSSDRQAMQAQVDQLTQANSSIIQNTQYNGTQLLNNGQSVQFQVGANANSSDQISVSTSNLATSAANGGLSSYNANLDATGTINISTQSAALAAQSGLQSDLDTLSGNQAQVGASSNQFEAAIGNLQSTTLAEQQANSSISDTDYAAASAQLAQQQIISQSALAVQAQANISPATALSLLS